MYFRSFYYLVGLAGLCLGAQDPLGDSDVGDPLDETFEQKVERALEDYHIPGLAISVVRDEETFAKGYGVADIETSEPVSEHTLFFGGSTTKAVTAAAMSLLVDDNVYYPDIQWDTPIHSIIPEDFDMIDPWYTTHVTITDMLSHRSGLPRHDLVVFANSNLQETVRKIRHLPLTAEIRTTWQYCNLMYMTAAYLIEYVTRQSFTSFVKDRILDPLEMSETYFSIPEALNDGRNLSQGYYYVESQDEVFSTNLTYNDNIQGAGNILTSVSDYSRWVSALLHRKPPISEAGYSVLFGAHSIVGPEPVPPLSSPDLYAMGWIMQTYRGEPMLQHAGSQSGFGALVMLLPKQKLGLAILGNNMMGTNAASVLLAMDIIDRILDVPDDERYDWEKKIDDDLSRTKLTNDTLQALFPDLPDPLQPLPLNVSAFEGTYTHPAYPAMTLSADCPERGIPKPQKWTGHRMCVWLATQEFFSEMVMDIFHLSGPFWTVIYVAEGTAAAFRAEFRISASGNVSQLGVDFDDMMKLRGEKIWWDYAAA